MKKILVIVCIGFLNSCIFNRNHTENSIMLSDALKNVSTPELIPIDSVVLKKEFVKLENSDSCIIGDISNVCESNDSYFIVSKGFLYQFDKNGKFDKRIGQKGRGPEEYLSIKALFFNESNQCIYILDHLSRKVLKYSSNGEFIKKVTPVVEDNGLYFSSFFSYDEKIALYSPSNSEKMNLICYNESDSTTEYISKTDEYVHSNEATINNFFPFGNDRSPMIYNYFNDTVYTLRDSKLIPTFQIVPGDLKIQMDNLIIDLDEPPVPNSNKRLYMKNIVKAGNYIFIFYDITHIQDKMWTNFLALYNINEDKYSSNINIKDTENDWASLNGGNCLVFQGNEDNTLIMVKYPYMISDMSSNLKIGDDSNPILIKYWIR